MPTKIRLARHGRKRHAFYHIVIADSRAPRDGRYIERVGSYNPNTNPATIEIDFDKTLDWLQKGAQPTDTVRAILRYKGVIFKNHLINGVKKGAFSLEVAEEKFKDWLEEKGNRIQKKTDLLSSEIAKAEKKRIAAEAKIKEEKAALYAEKNTEISVEGESEEAVETADDAEKTSAEVVETPEATAETTTETAEAKEAPAEEAKGKAKEEAKEEVKEESKEESKEETKE